MFNLSLRIHWHAPQENPNQQTITEMVRQYKIFQSSLDFHLCDQWRNNLKAESLQHKFQKGKGKAIPVQAYCRPRGFQEVKAPRFQDNHHMKVVRFQPYAPAAFTPRKYRWYSFLLEAEFTPGPWCGRKDYVNKKFQLPHQ